MGLVMPPPPKRHVNMYGIYGFFWRDDGGGGVIWLIFFCVKRMEWNIIEIVRWG